MKQLDSLNHILGNYIATGVNNPKKYPKEPALGKDKKVQKFSSDKELEMIHRIKYKRN